MRFSAYEILTILTKQSKLTRDGIRDRGGPHPRVQQRILNENPLYRVKDETALLRLLQDMDLLPWDISWQFPLSRLRELQDINDLHGMIRELDALFQSALFMIDANTFSRKNQRLGALLFTGLFLLPFASAKNTRLTEYQTLAKSRAADLFRQFIVEMGVADTPVNNLVKANAAANIVVLAWNARKPSERGADDMKGIVEQAGYFCWLEKQIEAFPKLTTAPYNALAIASTFCWRHCYERLQSALTAADNTYADIAKFQDDDFKDFREWAALQARDKKVSRMKNLKARATAAAGIAALFVGLMTATCGSEDGARVVGSDTIRVSDLKPHTVA